MQALRESIYQHIKQNKNSRSNFVTYYKSCLMKHLQFNRLLICTSLLFLSFSLTNYQDAKKDAQLISLGTGACKAGLVQMAIKNNSATKKIDVLIIKKEIGGGITTTSTTKYSGLPPGHKQPIGCGGSSTKDSLVVRYSIGAAVYSN